MTSDRNRRIEELFAAAIALPIGERETFVRAQCGEDEQLFNNVWELVRHGEINTDSEFPNPFQLLMIPADSLPSHKSEAANLAGRDEIPFSPQLAFNSRAESEDMIPTFIGRYRVTRRLGSGGYATVYHAFDPKCNRDVAIKVLKTNVATLVNEAGTLGRLRHSGIVEIYDAPEHVDLTKPGGEKCQCDCLVLEYIDGQTLAGAIQSRQLSQRQCVEIMATVATAVAFAHNRGFLHRDLKPQNILIDRDGNPKVADFGITIRLEDVQGIQHVGTPAYMSPEQTRRETLTVSSDVWSLGVVFYEMLTGRRPFDASGRGLAILIQTAVPNPLTQVRENIDSAVAEICVRCLSKEPEDRYPSAMDLADDLQRWLAQGTGRKTIAGRAAFSSRQRIVPGSFERIPPDSTAEVHDGIRQTDSTNVKIKEAENIASPLSQFEPLLGAFENGDFSLLNSHLLVFQTGQDQGSRAFVRFFKEACKSKRQLAADNPANAMESTRRAFQALSLASTSGGLARSEVRRAALAFIKSIGSICVHSGLKSVVVGIARDFALSSHDDGLLRTIDKCTT